LKNAWNFYEEALVAIHTLRGRGVIGERNESKWTASPKPPVISQNQNRHHRLDTNDRELPVAADGFSPLSRPTTKPTETKNRLKNG